MTVKAPNDSLDLSLHHRRMLFDESSIAPEIAAERGYWTARRGMDVPQDRGELPEKPGLVIPIFSPDGRTQSYQLRPNRKGNGPKYWSPGGRSPIIDVHPRMLEEVQHGDRPLLITEGAKTGDAATSRGIPTVVLAGVWMWCVPGVRPYRLKSCFDYVRLEGREVYVAFDSDCMTKVNVQQALAAIVEALEERGAVAKVIYLPDAPDGSKQGIDDFLAAGGSIKEMFMLAREFEPADIGEIRMSRDEKLRAAIRYLWRSWFDADWMQFVGNADNGKGNWARGHTARDTEEAMIEIATRHGKLDGDGLVFEAGLRRIAQMAAKSAPSVGKAVRHLEAAGRLEILPPAEEGRARRYRLIVPRATFNTMEGGILKEDFSKEEKVSESRRGAQGCKGLRAPTAPRLRWSSPARPGRVARHREPSTGRRVSEAVGENVFVPSDYRPYSQRLGPHRGAVLDVLEAAGGQLHLEDLCETLHRQRARPRDVKRRILKPLEKAGIIECEGDVIRLAADWLARLEEERERKGEIEQAERQAEKHREQGRRYREHLEREKRGTPAASLAAVRRTKDLRERRLKEARKEEARDSAPTPPAVEAFVEKIMGQHDRMRMGLLCEIAMGEGLRWRDVPPAVRRMGYSVERLCEYGSQEFVFARVAA